MMKPDEKHNSVNGIPSRGFTLIEMMVVVVVIGILAAIAIPNYIAVKNRALEASVKGNMQALQMAVEEFSTLVQGVYPGDLDTRIDDILDPDMGAPIGIMSLAGGARIPPFPPTAFLRPHPGLRNPFNPGQFVVDNLLMPFPPVPPPAIRGCMYYSSFALDGVTPGTAGQAAYTYRVTAYGDKDPINLTLP